MVLLNVEEIIPLHMNNINTIERKCNCPVLPIILSINRARSALTMRLHIGALGRVVLIVSHIVHTVRYNRALN